MTEVEEKPEERYGQHDSQIMSFLHPRYHYVPVNSKTAHPPGQTPGHLTFLNNFGQIPRYIAIFRPPSLAPSP